jgi:hypothetical protein
MLHPRCGPGIPRKNIEAGYPGFKGYREKGRETEYADDEYMRQRLYCGGRKNPAAVFNKPGEGIR